MNEKMWKKAAKGKADWAIDWGEKHNKAVSEAGYEIIRLLDINKASPEQILRTSAYIVCTRLYHREVLNDDGITP
jgi:hypothetical protein